MVLGLSSGLSSIGVPTEDCQCATIPDGETCQIMRVYLENDLREAYSCVGIIVNSENPYRDIFDLYNPYNCQEYPQISGDLPSRYYVDMSNVPPGGLLELMVCNDTVGEIFMDIGATPSGLCRPSECVFEIACPDLDTVFLDQQACEYIIPDYTDRITYADTCNYTNGKVSVRQYPKPGSILTSDTEVELTVYVNDGLQYPILRECSFPVILEVDDQDKPDIQVDFGSLSAVYSCGDALPEHIDFIVNMENVSFLDTGIDTIQDDYCEDMQLMYHWTGQNDCGLSYRSEMLITIEADNVAPEILTELEDIPLTRQLDCYFIGKLPKIDVADDCSAKPKVTASLYDHNGKYLGDAQKEIKLTEADGYIVYEVEDDCANLTRDTIRLFADAIPAPEFNCLDDITFIVSPDGECEVEAEWSVPSVNSNCTEIMLTQVQGPKPGDVLGAGQYEVVYEASDLYGNISQCRFSIVVEELSRENFRCVDINYSVDPSCKVDLLYDVIYEYNMIACTYQYDIILRDQGGIEIPDEEFIQHIGQRIQYDICFIPQDFCCTADILLEDKQAPIIQCEDYTFDCFDQISSYRPIVNNECREIDWKITKVDEIHYCDEGEIITDLIYSYTAVDIAGNASEPCIQTLSYRRPDLTELVDADRITFPKDTIIDCSLFNAKYPDLGAPMIDGVRLDTIGDNHCHLKLSHEDVVLLDQGCYRKILRRWKISDGLCYDIDNSVSFPQLIEFRDTTAPHIHLTRPALTVRTNSYECAAQILLPAPDVYDDCSDDIKITHHSLNKAVKIEQGVATLEPGVHEIVYTAYDECLNASSDTMVVKVIDEQVPTAVCLEHTVISLSGAQARLYAADLDVDSYDVCGPLRFEVRKMEVSCTDQDTILADFVDFCCAEVGSEVMVVLRVYDGFDNWSECMVVVDVQNKQLPVLTCPETRYVTCDTDIYSSDWDALFGAPAIDGVELGTDPDPHHSVPACEDYIIDQRIDEALNECGLGILYRHIYLQDAAGQTIDSCVQEIHVSSTIAFEDYYIEWPAETVQVYGCEETDRLPEITGIPWIEDGICELIGTSYSDEIYYVENSIEAGICHKVLRTWEVIDWCNKDSYDHARYYDQWIKVYEDTISHAAVSGTVYQGYSDTPMSDVLISFSSSTLGHDIMTDASGSWTADAISASGYTVGLSYADKSPLSGITALDAHMMQSYILGLKELSPLQAAAADVNGDGRVTILDLAELNKLVLGITNEFTHGDTWRFFDRDQSQAGELVIGDEFSYAMLGDIHHAYGAYKIGDVFQAKSNIRSKVRTTETLFAFDEKPQDEKNGITISISDKEVVAVSGQVPAGLTISGDHIYQYDDLFISISSADLVFYVSDDITDAELQAILSDMKLKVDYMDGYTESLSVELTTEKGLPIEILLKQNSPNPFNLSTSIEFSISRSAEDVSVIVYDIYGQQVFQKKGFYTAGDHVVVISADDIGSSGVYYYSLQVGDQSLTERMILTE